MPMQEVGTPKNPLYPALVSFIARCISRRIGEALISRMSSSQRNFTAIVPVFGIQMKVYTGESIGRRMYYFHDFENEQTMSFLSLVDDTTILFDIGANMGYYSLLVSSKGGTAYAFEPSPNIIPWLKSNIELNKSEDKVMIVGEAVSDKIGTLEFYPNRPGNFGVGKIFKDASESAPEVPVTVPTNTFDHFAQKFGAPSLVKMDIEGAEYLVLKNIPEALKVENAPTLFIEFHPGEIEALGGTVSELRQKLSDIGYRPYRLRGVAPETHEWEVFSKQKIDNDLFVEAV